MAAPTTHVKVSGAWKAVNKPHVKVSGAWKEVLRAYVRVSGVWKKVHEAVAPPSFIDAGAGAVEVPVSGTMQVPYPATINSGDMLVCNVYSRASAASGITLPAGWTSIASIAHVGNTGRMHAFYKIADGTETGNLDVTVTTSSNERVGGRMYRFSGASSVEAAGSATSDTSANNLDCVNVTTLGANRLAVQLFGARTGGTSVGDASGESGADYAGAVAEYVASLVLLDCQVASVATATAITGGSATIDASATHRTRIGFALVP